MNILFTCAGRRVALLDAFRRALTELDLDGKLLAADVTYASPAYHKADGGLIVPPTDRPEYVPALLEAVRTHQVSLLVPLTDLDLLLLAHRRQEFADLGCTVMIASEPTVRLCRDKARFSQALTSAGLPGIRTCTLEEFSTRPFYPCFLKPVTGSAGIGAGQVRDAMELTAHVAIYGPDMLVQEYIPGQEFTIDVYRTRAGEVRCVVPRQRLAVRSGEVEKGVTVKDDGLTQAAIRLASAMGDLWGVFCCQCRRPNQRSLPRFFEINPRFGGGVPLSIAAGANLPLYLLQEIAGLEVTAQLGRFTDHLLMLRYDEAVFVRLDDASSLPGHDTPEFR